jgi:hypothetical protein
MNPKYGIDSAAISVYTEWCSRPRYETLPTGETSNGNGRLFNHLDKKRTDSWQASPIYFLIKPRRLNLRRRQTTLQLVVGCRCTAFPITQCNSIHLKHVPMVV